MEFSKLQSSTVSLCLAVARARRTPSTLASAQNSEQQPRFGRDSQLCRTNDNGSDGAKAGKRPSGHPDYLDMLARLPVVEWDQDTHGALQQLCHIRVALVVIWPEDNVVHLKYQDTKHERASSPYGKTYEMVG